MPVKTFLTEHFLNTVGYLDINFSDFLIPHNKPR